MHFSLGLLVRVLLLQSGSPLLFGRLGLVEQVVLVARVVLGGLHRLAVPVIRGVNECLNSFRSSIFATPDRVPYLRAKRDTCARAGAGWQINRNK